MGFDISNLESVPPGLLGASNTLGSSQMQSQPQPVQLQMHQSQPVDRGSMSTEFHSAMALRPKIQSPLVNDTQEQIFHPFPRLPTELRLKIWRYAPSPRVVEVQYGAIWWAPLESAQIPCGLLGANHESRESILKNWLPLCRYAPSNFSSGDPGSIPAYYQDPLADMSSFSVCYFNPDIDTLYLGPSTSQQFEQFSNGDEEPISTYSKESLESLATIDLLSKLRFIACDEQEWRGYGGIDVDSLVPFPSLEQFYLVLGDNNYFDNPEVGKSLKGKSMEVSLHDVTSRTEPKLRKRAEVVQNMFLAWNGKTSVEEWKVSLCIKLVLRGGRNPKELARRKGADNDSMNLGQESSPAESDRVADEEG